MADQWRCAAVMPTYMIEGTVFLHEEDNVLNVLEGTSLNADGRSRQTQSQSRVPHVGDVKRRESCRIA